MSIQSRPARLALDACASLLAGPTLAQTSAVQLYGTLEVGVGQMQVQLPGPPNAAISPKGSDKANRGYRQQLRAGGAPHVLTNRRSRRLAPTLRPVLAERGETHH